jgi:hypothetical protein
MGKASRAKRARAKQHATLAATFQATIIADQDYDALLHAEPDTDPALPLALHTHTPTTIAVQSPYHLGSFTWSPQFARYIGGIVPSIVVNRKQRYREWWTVDGVREFLLTRYSSEQVLPVLEWLDAQAQAADVYALRSIADYYLHSFRWFDQLIIRMAADVRREYLPKTA